MKNLKFNIFDYLKSMEDKGAMVNLDKISSLGDLLSIFSKHSGKLIHACFKNKGSPLRLVIFKNFLSHVWKMKQCHGSKHVVNYLKGSHLAIQKFIAGTPVSSLKEILGPGVYPRLASGLPKFINLSDRKLIRSNNTSVIRFYLTLFSVYRILDCPKQLKLSTITDPFTGDVQYLEFVKLALTNIVYRHFNFSKYYSPVDDLALLETSSNPGIEKISWVELRTNAGRIWNSPLKDSFMILLKRGFGNHLQILFEIMATTNIVNSGPLKGYLCTKDEPAGKVRVFAMVDIWTQNVLKSLHNATFSFLKSLPNDGTFDQWSSVHRAVSKAKAYGKCFGYDLSAATDRLPISLQSHILNIIFKDDFGTHWANLLVGREYELRSKPYGDHCVKYTVGQPMGALSSWAMLAITHHALVQLAYKQAYPIREDWFDGYELLGDDIVIFDELVSIQYLSIMKGIGLEINLMKSVVSLNGDTVEFAKKTYYQSDNVSGLPWKAVFKQTSILGIGSLVYSLYDKYNFSKSIRWVDNWLLTKSYTKRNLLYFTLIKIFASKSGSNTFRIFDEYRKALGKLSIKNINKANPSLFIKYLTPFLKGNPLNLKEFIDNQYSDMFRLVNSKRITLLKFRDVNKDAESLARDMLFLLYPEYENDFYRSNISVENWGQNLDDPAFSIFYGLYWVIVNKLHHFRDKAIHDGIPDLDELFVKIDHADRYFELLELVKRSVDKINGVKLQPKSVGDLKSFIKIVNKSDFKFF
jgi:hypothetical protein